MLILGASGSAHRHININIVECKSLEQVKIRLKQFHININIVECK